MNKPPPGARFPASLNHRAEPGTRTAATVLRPQRPLHEAARDAVRQAPPSGIWASTCSTTERAAAAAASSSSQPCCACENAIAGTPKR